MEGEDGRKTRGFYKAHGVKPDVRIDFRSGRALVSTAPADELSADFPMVSPIKTEGNKASRDLSPERHVTSSKKTVEQSRTSSPSPKPAVKRRPYKRKSTDLLKEEESNDETGFSPSKKGKLNDSIDMKKKVKTTPIREEAVAPKKRSSPKRKSAPITKKEEEKKVNKVKNVSPKKKNAEQKEKVDEEIKSPVDENRRQITLEYALQLLEKPELVSLIYESVELNIPITTDAVAMAVEESGVLDNVDNGTEKLL